MLSDANNAFACDLYRQLASENSSNNLFFSPSSMFNSLIIAADGARGETARQMGMALHFPPELSCGGNEHDDLVWDLSPMHENISELNTRLAGKDDPETASLRPRIAELSAELEAVNRKVRQLRCRRRERKKYRLPNRRRKSRLSSTPCWLGLTGMNSESAMLSGSNGHIPSDRIMSKLFPGSAGLEVCSPSISIEIEKLHGE